MFGIGIPELIIIAVVFSIFAGPFLARRSGGVNFSGPTLVLRQFKIDESSTDGFFVNIIGRPSGLIAWLLTLLRFDTESILKVSESEIMFASSSLFGEVRLLTPLTSVSSTLCGYSKPIGFLISAVIFIIGGLIAGTTQRNGGPIILFCLVIAAVLIVLYVLAKKIAISIETSGGRSVGLIFKRSVIENVAVDIQKAQKAIKIINAKVLDSQRLKRYRDRDAHH